MHTRDDDLVLQAGRLCAGMSIATISRDEAEAIAKGWGVTTGKVLVRPIDKPKQMYVRPAYSPLFILAP